MVIIYRGMAYAIMFYGRMVLFSAGDGISPQLEYCNGSRRCNVAFFAKICFIVYFKYTGDYFSTYVVQCISLPLSRLPRSQYEQ